MKRLELTEKEERSLVQALIEEKHRCREFAKKCGHDINQSNHYQTILSLIERFES